MNKMLAETPMLQEGKMIPNLGAEIVEKRKPA
jgi:hypothetical protein